MTSIRITINEDIERILKSLKGEYPTLDYPELFKLGLAELYHKRELEARELWAESLPVLELSEEEQDNLAAALDEANREPARVLSLEQLKAELKAAITD